MRVKLSCCPVRTARSTATLVSERDGADEPSDVQVAVGGAAAEFGGGAEGRR